MARNPFWAPGGPGWPIECILLSLQCNQRQRPLQSQLANHLFSQWRLSFLSWVVWVVVLPSSRWDIESIVTQDTSISETPCVTVCVCFELGSFGGHLLSIHSHFPVAEDRSSLLRPANLVSGRRAGGPPLPVLNEHGESPLLQRVLRTWSTEACQEHLFFSWGCKSWGDTPFDRVNRRSGSADECSCGVANGPRVVNLDMIWKIMIWKDKSGTLICWPVPSPPNFLLITPIWPPTSASSFSSSR